MDEKWTVFRRYSRFLEMHRGLKLKYPEVRDASPRRRSSSFAAISSVLTSTRPPSLPPPQLAALEFPPKKLFGNRDERMVAERRNHLEAKTTSIKSHFARVGRIANFQRLFVCLLFLAALPEEPVPRDAVVLRLAPLGRRPAPHQTRRVRVLAVLQEGRLRVQQPRHRMSPNRRRRTPPPEPKGV